MIDTGGEFKSNTLTSFLKDLGITILTSVPHMHQQNGYAESFIRTLMDKAQAMCFDFDACLPQSWWSFCMMYALHIYNRTTLKCHNWKMPFEVLGHTKPDVSHLRVLGCGTYIFLPDEVHPNKLAPHAELMTFIGLPEWTKGYLFMRSPNNVMFVAAQALFDERLFPKCPDMHRPGYSPVGNPEPQQGEHNTPEGDENGSEGGGDITDLPVPPLPTNPRGNPPGGNTLLDPPDHPSPDPSDDFLYGLRPSTPSPWDRNNTPPAEIPSRGRWMFPDTPWQESRRH